MNKKNIKIGDCIECIAVSGKKISGQVIHILENTVIVSNGIDTEVIRKKDLILRKIDI